MWWRRRTRKLSLPTSHASGGKRRRPRLRRVLVTALLLFLTLPPVLLFTFLSALNAPRYQQALLRFANRWSQWEVSVGSLDIGTGLRSIDITNLTLHNKHTNDDLVFPEIHMRVSSLSLLRGVLFVDQMDVRDPMLTFTPRAYADQPKKPIKLRTLLVWRRLSIAHATVTNPRVILPSGRYYSAGALSLSFIPKFLRDVALDVEVRDAISGKLDTPPLAIDTFVIQGKTSISTWSDQPPFINDLDGTVTAQTLHWRRLVVDSLALTARLHDAFIELSHGDLMIGGAPLQLKGALTFSKKSSQIDIHMPEPITIPDMLTEQNFFRTASTVQGDITWKGMLSDHGGPSGIVEADLTQIPTEITVIPIHLQLRAAWLQGVMQIDRGALHIGEGVVNVHGTLDLPKKNLDLQFDTASIPILGVTGRFRNPDFHPIDGLARCKGTFRGWGKEYALDLDADTLPGASYQLIVLEQAHMQMQLTYPKLHLEGSVMQRGAAAGKVALDVRYGATPLSGVRPSSMQLIATLNNFQLDPAFVVAGLTGTATNGTLALEGNTAAPHGRGAVEIHNGALSKVPFAHFKTTFAWDDRTLRLSPITLDAPPLGLFEFPGPLVITIDKGARLAGNLGHGLGMDIAYSSLSKAWTITKVTLKNPTRNVDLTVSGTGRNAAWDLHARGTADAAWLQYFPDTIREADGAARVDVTMRGNFSQPNYGGTITLLGNRVLLRALPQELARLQGTIALAGKRLLLRDTQGWFGEGPFTLGGWVDIEPIFTISRYDLALNGRSLLYAAADRSWRAEFDANTHLIRTDGKSTLVSGDVSIVDLRYTKDFRVLEQAGENEAKVARARMRDVAAGLDQIRLDVHVVSRGDIIMRNNAAEVSLRAQTHVIGTLANPQIQGKIETSEGKLHYFGLTFEVTNGNVEFHAPFAEPFVEFRGEQTVGTHLVQVLLRGPLDNLRVELSSIPNEDRKNILCLVAYGTTCDQLRNVAFGSKIGPGVFAEELSKILERPLAKLTKLDIVRVESAVGTTDISRLHIGKRINDRLEIGFVTTVGQTAAHQSLEATYQLTDFLLLKASQSTKGIGGRVTVRFRER